MKLTTYFRQGFILSVMNDVPTVDHSDQIRTLVRDDLIKLAPPAVQKIWADKKSREWVVTRYGVFFGVSMNYPAAIAISGERPEKALSPEVQAECERLRDLMLRNKTVRETLHDKLRAVVNGCSTRKQLADRLPEFAHYLPSEAVKAPNLPALANLSADFARAGWPKGKKPVAEA